MSWSVLNKIKLLSTVHEAPRRPIYGACFNPYLKKTPYFATVSENRICIYCLPSDSPDVKLLRCFQDPSKDEAFYTVCWAYDVDSNAHVAIAGGLKGVIRVVDVESEECYNTLIGHGDAINDVRVSPKDSMIIASASKDFTARLWNIRNSSCLAILGGVNGHLDQVISVDFDSSSNFLASASMDHTVKLWYIGPGSCIDRLIVQSNVDLKLVDHPAEVHFPRCTTRDIHTNYVDCVRIFHRLIVSKSTEDEIVIWKFGDLQNNDRLEGASTKVKTESSVLHLSRLFLPDSSMWFMKFEIDPKERFIVCGNERGELHIWNLRCGYIPSKSCDFLLHCHDVSCAIRQVTISPDGEHLIAVTDGGSISRLSCELK